MDSIIWRLVFSDFKHSTKW